MQRSHRRALLGAASVSVLLASCLHFGPPSVAPSGTLGPHEGARGPRSHAPFGVAHAGPKGQLADRREPQVTVLFNRAMRSLDAGPEPAVPNVAVKTSDGRAIAGTTRWVGTHGVLFQPNDELPGATKFEVTVAAATTAVDGSTLGRDYQFQFETPKLDVARVLLPREGGPIAPKEAVRVVFNQAVDPAEVQRAITMTVRSGPADPGKTVPVTVTRGGTNGLVDTPSAWVVAIAPASPLPLDASVSIVLAKGLRGSEGDLRMEHPYTLETRTYGPLALVDFHCPRIRPMGRCQARNDVTVTFSNPVEPAQLAAHLRMPGLKAKPRKKGEGRPTPTAGPTQFLDADPQAGRKYKVTVTAGLRDVFGQTLAKDATFELDTEAPFVGTKPAAKSARATEEAKPPPPGQSPPPPPPEAGPTRPELAYELQLGLEGRVVEALANGGIKSHKVPVGSVNVPTFGLVATPLAEKQTLVWLGGPGIAKLLQDGGASRDLVSPGAAENVRAVRTIDLDSLLGGAQKRGTALLSLDVPGESNDRTSLVTVTDLGVTAKFGGYGTNVWVTSLATGKPVEGAVVSIRVPDEGEIATATTDAEGLAIVPHDRFDPRLDAKGKRRGPTFAFVRKDDDWTYEPLAAGRTDSQLGVARADANEKTSLGMVYTDRGVYRPGETIELAGLVRGLDPAGLVATAGRDVKLELFDGRGSSVATARAQTDAFGAFAVDVHVPEAAHLGDARISATVRDGSRRSEFDANVQILAFEASEFKVAVTPSATEIVRGGDVSFEVNGQYLFGAPMKGASVHSSTRRSPTAFKPKNTDGFVTADLAGEGDQLLPGARSIDMAGSDDVLDDQGKFTRKAHLAMSGQHGPERVSFEADVEDFTRRDVASQASVLVHPAAVYLGIEELKDSFVSAGATLSPRAITVAPDGAAKAGQAVHLELVRRTFRGAIEENGGTAHRTSVPEDRVVASCDLTTAATPKGCDLRVDESGAYVLRGTTKDADGNVALASLSFYALDDAPGKHATVAWAQNDSRSLRLEANREQYEIGQTAKVLVKSPFENATAIVTVERNGVLYHRTIDVHGPMPVIPVPVLPEFYPNAYIGVHLVRGRVSPPPAKGADVGGPDFRSGYLPLAVNPEAHRLTVEVQTDKKEYHPGEEVTATFAVTDRDKRGVASELTIYAVDEGVLMLTGYATPDPLPAFTRDRALAVTTAESREDLARIVPMRAGERVPILGWELAEESNGYDKGRYGGGGGGEGEHARADFKSTAYFEAGKLTTTEGRAQAKFTLPDNLTTFRLMAIAAATGDSFGAGQTTLTTSEKLMARPALPRKIRVGDAFDASVVVTSKQAEGGDVQVDFDAPGLTLKSARSVHVSVPKGGSAEARFSVVAEAPGDAQLTFDVRGLGASDKVRVKRAVELPLSEQTAAAYGETTSAAAISLGDLSKIRGDRGGLTVKLAKSALVGLGTSVERLVDYPYGCTEQLASRTLPMLELEPLARAVGARLPAHTDAAIDQGVAKMLEHQRHDGGFGFWEDSDTSEPWLSAYALLVLSSAQKAGRFVPSEGIESDVQYLRRNLEVGRFADREEPEPEPAEPDAPPPPEGARTDAEKARIDYASAAFIVDALATVGSPDPGYMTRLFEVRKGQALFARALLLHALAVGHGAHDDQVILAKEIEPDLQVGADVVTAPAEPSDVYAGLLDSSARTTAFVLRALVAFDPQHPLAARLAKGLLGLRRDGAWASTQENAWALLALKDYRAAQEKTAPSFETRLFLGDDMLLRTTFDGGLGDEATTTVAAEKLRPHGREPLTMQVVGDGKLYYAAELRYDTAELPARPRDDGFFVQKLVRAVKPDELDEAAKWFPKESEASAPAGGLVLVDLLLESAEPQHQVVVDDPLPSGLQAIDTALAISSQHARVADEATARDEAKQATDPRARTDLGTAFKSATTHREVHDDRVLTFIEDLEPGMYHFRYLARATAIGRFVVPPTTVTCMYSPEISGRTGATTFEITPGK